MVNLLNILIIRKKIFPGEGLILTFTVINNLIEDELYSEFKQVLEYNSSSFKLFIIIWKFIVFLLYHDNK